MGELVVSNEGGGGRRTENEEGDGGGMTAAATSNIVRWEKFLPRMVLRVLLVEADDSTRQLITALLRKCNYKVAAVSDGLKAWEVLKGRPHNIDLILTEVELPSVSGFALLTLIGEHEVCKNIPVIMMSAHDSVSTVYKCMLRGAADFLVKPVRKNELKNLWQHVWRRQASTSGTDGPQEESDAQQKVEATAENNATSNHSSGYMACIKRNRECIEKGSDAQSSCTKPDMEVEVAHMEHVKDLSQSKWTKSHSRDMRAQKHEESVKASQQLLTLEDEVEGKNANTITQGKDMALDNRWERDTAMTDARDNDHLIPNCSREAIDLIGAFDSYPTCSQRRSLDNGAIKVDSSPLLDLSLRRSHPSGSVNQVTDERQRLKHSDASAFSRYINRTPVSLHSGSASICNQQKEHVTNSDKPLSNYALEDNSDTHGPSTMSAQQNVISLVSGQHGQAESHFQSLKQRVFPVPVPVRSLRFENLCTGYGSALPPTFCTQSGLTPMQSPGSSGHQEPSFRPNPYYMSNPEAQQFQNLMDRKANNATEQTDHKQGKKLESLEDQGHVSSANDQSASSSFCNPTLSRLNSVGSGSNVNVNLVRAAGESGNESSLVQDGTSHRSMQREAALLKFRMKRKDRCYEKKVRYESRKKLAEQRPRVKGQFVRQVLTSEPLPMETEDQCGSSPPR